MLSRDGTVESASLCIKLWHAKRSAVPTYQENTSDKPKWISTWSAVILRPTEISRSWQHLAGPTATKSGTTCGTSKSQLYIFAGHQAQKSNSFHHPQPAITWHLFASISRRAGVAYQIVSRRLHPERRLPLAHQFPRALAACPYKGTTVR